MWKITMQLVILSGEGRWGQNLTNPTRHRLRWSKESETHQPKDPSTKCLQIPLREGMFNLCTKLYPRSFSKVRKNWQDCSQEFYWRMWIDSNTCQIAVFLLPGDSFWPMKHGWCHLCHFWVEACVEAQMWLSSLSLFPAPEAACSRWCMCKSLTDHKHL